MDHNEISILEKVGLREVSRKTHIGVKQLEYILQNRYEQLSKVKTAGFIKILSREYNIDFTEWLEGFNRYWAEHNKGFQEEQEKIFIKADEEKEPRKIFLFLLVFALISGLGGIAYTFQNNLNFDEFIARLSGKIVDKNGPVKVFDAPSVLQETAISLGVKVEERVVQSDGMNTTTKAVIVPREANETNKTASIIEKKSQTSAILSPKRKVWIGIVNLEDDTRKESTTDKNITVDLTKRQIIKTGNGYFELSYDGSIEDFTEQGSTRFLVEKGVISRISDEAFIKLNRGKNW